VGTVGGVAHAGHRQHTLTVTTSERKTGLYVPNVETNELSRDECGWLKLNTIESEIRLSRSYGALTLDRLSLGVHLIGDAGSLQQDARAR
jgi:hypothetical protein